MPRYTITSALLSLPVLVAACASDAPEPVRAAPIYDKMGNAGCVDGGGIVRFPRQPIPGTANVPQDRPLYLPSCQEICDDEPLYDAQGALIDPCLPVPERERDPGDDDSSTFRIPGTSSTPPPGTAPRPTGPFTATTGART